MKRKILTFLLLFGIGIFFKNNVFGAELLVHWGIEPIGGGEFEYLINRPYSGETFKPGEEIKFEGYVTLPGCHNGLYYNKLTFYVSEGEELHYELEDACANCLGASSDYEGIIIPDDQSCQCTVGGKCGDEKGAFNCKNVCKDLCIAVVIDEDRKIPRFYKFGAIYPPDLPYQGHEARRTDKVEFNQTYTLPSDICKKLNLKEGEKNKVYFWIQYSGLHSDCAWHSAIVYQEGYIDCSTQISLPPSPPPPPEPEGTSPSPPPPPEPEGIPPIAELIAPEIAIENTTVTLDGSKSRDPDGRVEGYWWRYSWKAEDYYRRTREELWSFLRFVFGKPEIKNFTSPPTTTLEILSTHFTLPLFFRVFTSLWVFTSLPTATLKIPYLPLEQRLLPPEAFDYRAYCPLRDPQTLPGNASIAPPGLHLEWWADPYHPPSTIPAAKEECDALEALDETLLPTSMIPFLPSEIVDRFREYVQKEIIDCFNCPNFDKRKERQCSKRLYYILEYLYTLKSQPPYEDFYSVPSPPYGKPFDKETIDKRIEDYKKQKKEKLFKLLRAHGAKVRVSLKVNDEEGWLSQAVSAVITVLPSKLPPIAVIVGELKEREITPHFPHFRRSIKTFGGYEGETITLDGSYSFDLDGGSITKYQWKVGYQPIRGREKVKILNPEEKIVQIQLPHLIGRDRADFGICLRVWDDENTPSPYECVQLWIYKKQTVTVNLTSDLTTDWIWQTKPLTLTWTSENASSCRRWIEVWNPFENIKLRDTSLGDKIPYDNWTSDWNDELSGTITTYPGSGPPDPQTGAQPRNWIGKLWIYKIECKDSSGQNFKEAEVQVNVKPRPIWQEVFPF